jgi:hypothetical protein
MTLYTDNMDGYNIPWTGCSNVVESTKLQIFKGYAKKSKYMISDPFLCKMDIYKHWFIQTCKQLALISDTLNIVYTNKKITLQCCKDNCKCTTRYQSSISYNDTTNLRINLCESLESKNDSDDNKELINITVPLQSLMYSFELYNKSSNVLQLYLAHNYIAVMSTLNDSVGKILTTIPRERLVK